MIACGTTEILENMLAERVFGLPQAPMCVTLSYEQLQIDRTAQVDRR